jgi:hypothetical protein
MLQGLAYMPQSFKSIALVGNAKDLRVAECMLSLAGHFHAAASARWSIRASASSFPPDSVVPCPEQPSRPGGTDRRDRRRRHAACTRPGCSPGAPVPLLGINRGRLGFSPT